MKIQENIPLAPMTTFKIGGPAKFFCEAGSEEEILEALKFAKEKNLPVFALGGGSNVLVSDKGFDGIAMKICDLGFKIYDSRIECGAGVMLSKIVNESAKADLTGLEWAAGIPGTIGGAVRGNAGARALGGEMSDIVESVKILNVEDLRFATYDLGMCKYGYRESVFKHNPKLLIISVILNLKKGNQEKSEEKIKEILAKRKEKQPFEFPSPGSYFRNPEVKDEKIIKQFETNTSQKTRDNKIPAPWLIEEAGLKRKKVGGAMVAEKHANFIVNTGGATAEDVITLAAVIKTRVRNKFGIQLEEEVQMVGF